MFHIWLYQFMLITAIFSCAFVATNAAFLPLANLPGRESKIGSSQTKD
jgi:hypothetical protein